MKWYFEKFTPSAQRGILLQDEPSSWTLPAVYASFRNEADIQYFYLSRGDRALGKLGSVEVKLCTYLLSKVKDIIEVKDPRS